MLSSGRRSRAREAVGAERADVDERRAAEVRGRAPPRRSPGPAGSRGRRSRWRRGTATPRRPRRSARCGPGSSRRARPSRRAMPTSRSAGARRSMASASPGSQSSDRAELEARASRPGRTCPAAGRGPRRGSRTWSRSRWSTAVRRVQARHRLGEEDLPAQRRDRAGRRPPSRRAPATTRRRRRRPCRSRSLPCSVTTVGERPAVGTSIAGHLAAADAAARRRRARRAA